MIETKLNWYRIRLIGARRLFFALLISLGVLPLYGQLGCIDPQAINYEPVATISDGSCVYAPTNLSSQELAQLPGELNECSGFVKHEEFFLGINDSGAGAELFFLDTMTFDLIQQQLLPGAANVDWEEIQTDAENLYVGDFGNNFGTRTDLKIYKLPLSGIASDPQVSEVIEFSYEDQTNFTAAPFTTPFDCEAFLVKGDSIHLFTKDWGNEITKHYWLPNMAGSHVARVVDSFDVDGLITGASWAADSLLLLTGYGSESFAWIVKDYAGQDFFKGNKRRLNLGNLGQNESITWLRDGKILITNEGGLGLGKVYLLDIEDFVTSSSQVNEPLPLHLFPNPVSDRLIVELPEWGHFEMEICDSRGRVVRIAEGNGKVALDLSSLSKGWYFLRVKNEKMVGSYPVLKLD